MAIVAVLAGIISVSVSGSGQTSRDTQSRQDATSVESALADYVGSRGSVEVLIPKVATVLGRIEVTQELSSNWPENFISDTYSKVFPEGEITTVSSVTFLNSDGTLSDLTARGLLQGYNAVDFDVLFDGGFLTSIPRNVSESSQDFSNYLWLLEKSITVGGIGEVASREVAVFRLVFVDSIADSDLVALTYRLLFGGEFSDQHPVASSQLVTTDEDTPISVTLSGTDFESCELTFVIEAQPSDGVLGSIIDNLCDPGEPNTDSASVTYLPDLNFNGIDGFTYSVIDGNGDDIATITVTINVVNDFPILTLSTLNDIEVDEDAGATSFDVSSAFDDADIATNSDSLTYTVSSSKPPLVNATIGPTTLGSILNLQFQPDQHGTAEITVRATDTSLVDFVESKFTVTVNSVNDTPSFTIGPDQTVNEDSGPQTVTNWATNISAGAANEEQDLTFNLSTNPLFSVHPAVSSTGTLTYTPATGAKGSATISVDLQDNGTGLLKSASQSFTITIIDPFQNGSFELNPINANNWSVDSGNIDWLPNTYWLPSDGIYSLDLNGISAGEISQTFDTVIGQDYIVLFDMSKNHVAPPTASLTVSAANDSKPYTFSTQTVAGINGNMHWTEESFSFTATDSTTTLTFKSNTTGASGPALDNVRVNAVIFSDSGQALGSSQSNDVSLGDLDGDGDFDAFVSNGTQTDQPNSVWFNDGSGNFTDSGQTLGSRRSLSVKLGDLDNDGDLDAFVANNPQGNTVWLNNGSGTFSDSGQSLGASASMHVALGDVDGDGDLDAVVANLGSGQANSVWLNNGSGTFSLGQSLGSSRSDGVGLGDLDGDGDLDVFVANRFSTPNRVWENDGSGNFTDSGQLLGSSYSLSVDLGDLDGDNDLDAYVTNVNQGDKVWLNNGSGTFTDSGQSLGTNAARRVALGDVDGDGDLDAFAADGGSIDSVWLNDGSGSFSLGQTLAGPDNSKGVGLADLDLDGDLDAFVANNFNQATQSNGGPNKVWLNSTGSALPSPQTSPLISGNGSIGGLDSFNEVSVDGGATWQPAHVVAKIAAWAIIPGTDYIFLRTH